MVNDHPDAAESAIVGFPHDIMAFTKGFVILNESAEDHDHETQRKEINKHIA